MPDPDSTPEPSPGLQEAAAPASPPPPRHLSPEASELWRELHAAYDFELQDEKTLRLALEALDRASQARRQLRREGITYRDRFDAPHQHPAVAIERDARQAWVKLMAALGLPTDEEPTLQPRRGRPRQQGRVARLKPAPGAGA